MPAYPQALATTPLALGPSDAAASGLTLPLDFALEPQEQDYWCWAAVSRFVLQALGMGSPRQCQLATICYGSECCDTADPVDRSAGLYEILDRLQPPVPYRYEGRGFLDDAQGAYREICRLIDAGRPTPILIGWNDGSWPHYVCAYGYGSIAGQAALWIYDPARAWRAEGNRRLKTLSSMLAYEQGPHGQTVLGRWVEAYRMVEA